MECCNAPDTTFHIRKSNSCLFRRCDMLFPSWLGFCLLFCIFFMSCISYHSIMRFASACFKKTRNRSQLPFLSLPPLSFCQALVLVDLSPTPSRASETSPNLTCSVITVGFSSSPNIYKTSPVFYLGYLTYLFSTARFRSDGPD